MPEPLDAIVLQCFAALPADVAIRLMQVAAYHAPVNGILDDDTMATVLRMRSAGVEELLLLAQAGFYIGQSDRGLCGMDLGAGLRRVERCNRFLKNGSRRIGLRRCARCELGEFQCCGVVRAVDT